MARKILIADDSDVFRQLESQLLAGQGYELLSAKNGAEAVKLAIEHLPDLLLLDVQMPIMDGVQVLGTLKKNETTKNIPIVIVTTIGKDTDKRLLEGGGANEVLSKPIDRAKLLATVRRLIGSSVA